MLPLLVSQTRLFQPSVLDMVTSRFDDVFYHPAISVFYFTFAGYLLDKLNHLKLEIWQL